MSFIEWIGFLIAFVVLMLSVMRRIYEERRRSQHPEEYKKEREEREKAYSELLKSMGFEIEEEEEEGPKLPQAAKREEKQPSRPPVVRKRKPSPLAAAAKTRRQLSDEFEFRAPLDEQRKLSSIEQRHMGTRVHPKFQEGYGNRLVSPELRARKVFVREGAARVEELVERLPSRKMLIVAHEVIGPCKALR